MFSSRSCFFHSVLYYGLFMLLVTVVHSLALIYIYISLCEHCTNNIHFLINGQLGGSPNFAITKIATTNILVHVSLGKCDKFFLAHT